jgi:hypothetical protein
LYGWNVDTIDYAVNQYYEGGLLTRNQAVEMLLDHVQNGWYMYGIAGKTLREVRPGPWGSRGVRSNTDTILFHSKPITAEALDEILSWLKSEGYTFDVLTPAWQD